MELVEVAKEVHLSAKSLNITEGLSKVISKHENLHLHPQVILLFFFFFHNLINIYSDDIFMINLQIETLQEDGRVVFVDGSWLIADTILHCTG
jgi:hypothetical protein